MLVGLSGLEPLTSRLSGVRSNQLSYRPMINLIGGDEENRTPDPLLARQVLSHLSYAPIRRVAASSRLVFVKFYLARAQTTNLPYALMFILLLKDFTPSKLNNNC